MQHRNYMNTKITLSQRVDPFAAELTGWSISLMNCSICCKLAASTFQGRLKVVTSKVECQTPNQVCIARLV